MAGQPDIKTPRKTEKHMNGHGSVWKWISGLLASVLVTGISGFLAGTFLHRQSEESLKREVRVERAEFVTEFVDKRIFPKLDAMSTSIAQLEAGQNVILNEIKKAP